MKCIGGTWHGRDAPDWVQHLVVAGQREISLEEVPPEAYQPAWSEPEPPKGPGRIETYVVRTWRMNDREPFKFLAIKGKDRDWIESMAWPIFRA